MPLPVTRPVHCCRGCGLRQHGLAEPAGSPSDAVKSTARLPCWPQALLEHLEQLALSFWRQQQLALSFWRQQQPPTAGILILAPTTTANSWLSHSGANNNWLSHSGANNNRQQLALSFWRQQQPPTAGSLILAPTTTVTSICANNTANTCSLILAPTTTANSWLSLLAPQHGFSHSLQQPTATSGLSSFWRHNNCSLIPLSGATTTATTGSLILAPTATANNWLSHSGANNNRQQLALSFWRQQQPPTAGYHQWGAKAVPTALQGSTRATGGIVAAAGLTTWTYCPAGSTSDAGKSSCTLCPAGLVPCMWVTGVVYCPAGSTSDAGKSSCMLCPAGHYSMGTGNTQCKACPSGAAVAWDPALAYQSWPASFHSQFTTSACVQCPTGYHQPQPGSLTCLPCNAGLFAMTVGVANCSSCPVGKESTAGSSNCTACQVGYYASREASVCQPCPKGWYQGSTGQKACIACPVGTYTPASGSEACISCPRGTAAPVSGSNRCMYCSPGQYASIELGATSCETCPRGTFSNTSSATVSECISCPTGTYGPRLGMHNCTACPTGQYTCGYGNIAVVASIAFESSSRATFKPESAMLRPFCLNVKNDVSGLSERISICQTATVGELKVKACEALGLNEETEALELIDFFNNEDRGPLKVETKIEETDLQTDQILLLRQKESGAATATDVLSSDVVAPKVPAPTTTTPVRRSGRGMSLSSRGGMSSSFHKDTVVKVIAPTTSTPVRHSGRGMPLSSRGGMGSSIHKDTVVKAVDRPQGLAGLSNLGNTCFMNSSLQCLSHSLPLMNYFLTLKYLEDINRTNLLGMKGELADGFAHLLQNLWMGGVQHVCPRGFKQAIGNFAPQFSGYAQHDSQEFLGFMMDGLHEDLNRVLKKPYIEEKDANGRDDVELAAEAWSNYKARNDSFLVDHFQGLYKSTLNCPNCEHASMKFDPFMYLSLPLPESRVKSLTVTWANMQGEGVTTKYCIDVSTSGTVKDVLAKLRLKLGYDQDLDRHLMLLAKVVRTSHSEEVEVFTDMKTRVADVAPGSGRMMYGTTEFLVAYDFPSISGDVSADDLDHIIVHHQRPTSLGSRNKEFFGAAPLLLLLPKGEANADDDLVMEQKGEGYCKELLVLPGAGFIPNIHGALKQYRVAASVLESVEACKQEDASMEDECQEMSDTAGGMSDTAGGMSDTGGDSACGDQEPAETATMEPELILPTPSERVWKEIPIGFENGENKGPHVSQGARVRKHARRRGTPEPSQPPPSTHHAQPGVCTSPAATPVSSGEDHNCGSVIRQLRRDSSSESVTSRAVGGSAQHGKDDMMEVSSVAVRGQDPSSLLGGGNGAVSPSSSQDMAPSTVSGGGQGVVAPSNSPEVDMPPSRTFHKAGSCASEGVGTTEGAAASDRDQHEITAPSTGPFDMFAAQTIDTPAEDVASLGPLQPAPPFKLLVAKVKGETTMYSTYDRTKMMESGAVPAIAPPDTTAHSTQAWETYRYDTSVMCTPIEDESVTEAEAKLESSRNVKKSVGLQQCVKAFLQPEQLAEEDTWYCPKCKDHVQSSGNVKNSVALQQCVEAFLQPEQLADEDTWYCPKCKDHVQADKKLDLWSLPEVLVVHLKRFSYTKYNRNKLDTQVDFPLEGLDLCQYVMRPQDVEPIYDCFAVSNHFGSLGGGHYTAFCKMEDGKWFCYDDSHCSEVEQSEVISPAAYVLFYHRRHDHTTKYPPGALQTILEAGRRAVETHKAECDSSTSNRTSSSSGSLDQDQDQDKMNINKGNSGREMAHKAECDSSTSNRTSSSSGSLDQDQDQDKMNLNEDNSCREMVIIPRAPSNASDPYQLDEAPDHDPARAAAISLFSQVGGVGGPNARWEAGGAAGTSQPQLAAWSWGVDEAAGQQKGSPVGGQIVHTAPGGSTSHVLAAGGSTEDMLEAASKQLAGMPVFNTEEGGRCDVQLDDMYLDDAPEGAGNCSGVSSLAPHDSQEDLMACSGSED
eukprot:gene20878-27720_t